MLINKKYCEDSHNNTNTNNNNNNNNNNKECICKAADSQINVF